MRVRFTQNVIPIRVEKQALSALKAKILKYAVKPPICTSQVEDISVYLRTVDSTFYLISSKSAIVS